MAITDADPALVLRWKNLGKWSLLCQMVFVLKPLTQIQQSEDDADKDYKHKGRTLYNNNNNNNLDAPLLRLMLSLSSYVKKAIYGLREAPRLWPKKRHQKLRELEFLYRDELARLVRGRVHPGLWFIVEGAATEYNWIPPCDHSLRSDEWTAQLQKTSDLRLHGSLC